MRGFDLEWWEFRDLLSASPCTLEEARDLLQQEYAVKLPKTSYEIMWERLEEQLGEEEAADAVCELVIATASRRLSDLSEEVMENGPEGVRIRQNDSQLIHLIFDWATDDLTELGYFLFSYRVQRRGEYDPPKAGDHIAPEPKGSSDVVEHEEGFVYALINPSMPGLVKVGMTTGTSEARAKKMSGKTGVPDQFEVLYEFRTDSPRQAEKSVHSWLEGQGFGYKKEFFRAPPKIVIKAMQKIEEEMVP